MLYPFFFNANFDILEDGWLAFTLDTEYAKYRNSADFRLTDINKDFKVRAFDLLHYIKCIRYIRHTGICFAVWYFFQVCKSYPKLLVVPKSIDDETIIKAAKFRHHDRFPVLSYAHKSSGVSNTAAGSKPSPLSHYDQKAFCYCLILFKLEIICL